MGDSDELTPRLNHTVLTPSDGSVVVVLDGELDIATADALDAAVSHAITGDVKSLVVDATRLRFADSSAIALWVNWSRRVPRIEIRNPRPMVRRVIETMGLTRILNPS